MVKRYHGADDHYDKCTYQANQIIGMVCLT